MKRGITARTSYRLGRSLKGDVNAFMQKWSRKVGKHIKAKWPEVGFEIMGSMTDVGSEAWVSRHESLDRYWEWWGKVFDDKEVKRLVEEMTKKEQQPILI